MILLVSILLFFFIFFLALSANSIIRVQEEELKAKIADRLKAGDRTITSAQLERRERLSDLHFLDRALRSIHQLRKFQSFLAQSGTVFSVGSYLLFSALLSTLLFFAALLLHAPLFVALACSAGALTVPYAVVSFKRAGRIRRFGDRFPDAIGLMSSSLRVGHSLQMAVESVVKESKDIVANEFERVLSGVEVGQSFEAALQGILNRIDTPELRLFISAVLLQRETGGNLAELLDNLEAVIRERQELKRELKAATAQARLSGMVLSFLPVFVAVLVFIINPTYILFFFNDPIGTHLVVLCLVGQVMGAFTIRKIIQIEM